MTIGLFTDKEYQPAETAVLEALGAKRALWEGLTQFIADNYPIPGEWNFGGKNYGWNLWYRKSGKTLVTLYPQEGCFVAQIVLSDEEFRRRGYGRQALLTLEAKVKVLGIDKIALHVFAHNRVAQGLYESAGFEMTGIYMTKKLTR